MIHPSGKDAEGSQLFQRLLLRDLATIVGAWISDSGVQPVRECSGTAVEVFISLTSIIRHQPQSRSVSFRLIQ